MEIATERAFRRHLKFFGWIVVRIALGEIDGVMLMRHSGHSRITDSVKPFSRWAVGGMEFKAGVSNEAAN